MLARNEDLARFAASARCWASRSCASRRHHRGGVCAFQIAQEAAVLALQLLGLGDRALHHLALFDDLVRQRAGMHGKPLVRGQQLALLVFQQPLRAQAQPSLSCQFVGKGWPHSSALRP
jgi:hypothetical protein